MATRILIAEDEANIRAMMARYLSSEGFTVATACDGQEAIERLTEADFDVLVLDLMMPRVSGFGVLRFLAESENELLHRTIIASACVTPGAAAQLDDICRIIRKPFELPALLAAVTACSADDSQTVASAAE